MAQSVVILIDTAIPSVSISITSLGANVFAYIGSGSDLTFRPSSFSLDLTLSTSSISVVSKNNGESGQFFFSEVATFTIDGVDQLASLASDLQDVLSLANSAVSVIQSTASNQPATIHENTTPILAGQTYTSDWVNVEKYAGIVLRVKTDQDGTYYLQLSVDAISIDSSLVKYYRTTQIEPPHSYGRTAKYARFVFTNTSASNQSTFRYQMLAGSHVQLNIPIDATMAQDYDSISVRPSSFDSEVVLGRRQGWAAWEKFGYNQDLGAGATETIWAYGGLITFLTAASTFTIVSSSANDTNGGTGAQKVTLVGVDANRIAFTEEITLNGITPVISASSGLGLNRVATTLAGSGQTNAGNITITATTGGTVQGYIPAGKSTTQQSIFFTQDNHKALADFLVINCEKTGGGSSPKIQIRGFVLNTVTNTKTEIFYYLMDTTTENNVVLTPPRPFLIPEKSILYFEAISDTAASYGGVRFSLMEVRDVDA